MARTNSTELEETIRPRIIEPPGTPLLRRGVRAVAGAGQCAALHALDRRLHRRGENQIQIVPRLAEGESSRAERILKRGSNQVEFARVESADAAARAGNRPDVSDGVVEIGHESGGVGRIQRNNLEVKLAAGAGVDGQRAGNVHPIPPGCAALQAGRVVNFPKIISSARPRLRRAAQGSRGACAR